MYYPANASLLEVPESFRHFWAYAKLRLTKVKSIQNTYILLPFKETDFRFNHRCYSLYHVILKLLLERLNLKP